MQTLDYFALNQAAGACGAAPLLSREALYGGTVAKMVFLLSASGR